MQLVVADTGPLHYLVLTGDVEVLPKLFEKVLAPHAVYEELANPGAPASVRGWIASSRPWLEIRSDPVLSDRDPGTSLLDRGGRAAIALAVAIGADLVLIDERDGAAIARHKGLAVTGTLGILDLAAKRGMTDLAEAFERLKATSFYYRRGLLDALLAQEKKRSE